VLAKLGFELEWHEPGAVYFKGRWWDMLHYSLDRPETA
jgi:RimJ/RimL family protein N-acetyltransferase